MDNRSHQILKQKREMAASSKEARKKLLLEAVQIGRAYSELMNQYAWKHLMEAYLDERLDPQHLMEFLHSDEGKMKEEMVKMQALWDLMAFVQSQISNGIKATRELQKLGVRDSEI